MDFGLYTEDEISFFLELEYGKDKLKSYDEIRKQDKKRYQDELIKRYCFLYENSALILGCFINFYSLSGHILFGDKDPFKELRQEVVKNIGINNHYYHLGETYEFMLLIEESFLGNKPLEETELYSIITNINNRESSFYDIKEKFSLSNKGSEVTELDESFRVLLECVRVFVEEQTYKITSVRKNGSNYSSIGMFTSIQKKEVLDKYYSIQNYRCNCLGIKDDLDYLRFKIKLSKIPSETLVGMNDFILNFSTDYLSFARTPGRNDISDDDKKDIYFKYHDVLDWNLKVECIEDQAIVRPNNTSCCGKEFRVREGEIFFYEDSFYQLCPECSYIVQINKSLIPDSIRLRIKDRCHGDNSLFRKKFLLSELKTLDNDSSNKVLEKIIK